ncbi:MAG TPA: histidine kinase [Cyanobacteria bacterium UBA11371]|nr:histidine kinase [Cyanobacteria bacterium UBA11371]
MAVTTEQPHDWQPQEIQLLQEISSRIFPRIERARAEEALRESEAKYRSLFESIDDGFALLEVLYDNDDRPIDCRFLEVSPSFESHTGLPQAQGKTLRELIPSVESGWFDRYHQALVTNAPVHFEMQQEHLKIWFEVNVFPYGNPQDRRVTIVFRNINDRKQAQANQIQLIREQSAREQERQRAESLAELDRTKTLFFSNVSHEFRTPLTLLLNPLQDALSDRTHPLDPVHQERLELVHRNSLRLLKLVNTLLDFSRIEAGRMEAVYEPTDLAMFTTELASVFRSAIEQARLRLIVDCPPLPEPVYVDREMWEKIVLNLLSNAFKYTYEGEIAVRLHPADSDRVMLEIEDTGTGIAPEHLPHLFERFYQVRGVQARTHEGSGIGLALVHELIRLHNGTIDVRSIVGQGSCFAIALRFGTQHLPQDRLRLVVGDRITTTPTPASTALSAAPYIEEAQRWIPAAGGSVEFSVLSSQLEENSSTQNSKFKTQNSQTARILLVDDNADIRDYLTRILSDRFQVEAVADGAAALAAATERVPDLVLSDVMMPGLDGFELLRALRADPRTREIPIILLSARAGEESVVEGLEAGADDYLIKPFSAQELVSRVNGHLQMAQLRYESLDRERTLNRRKDELLSTVSHELNTPLVAILGWTRLLRANPSNQSMLMKSLETIERNAMLQAKLIQDLLDISRITAGKLRLSLAPVELKSVIDIAIATVTQTAQAKEIDLVWQENIFNQNIVVMGDRDRLQQIICNLLTNAIKFTSDRGNVTVELSKIGGEKLYNNSYAEVRVTDTGIGISPDFLPHIFDRFRQAEESGAAKGLGLGLAIARHLVELHNGTIHAQSAGVGQGSTFIVRLPLLKEF